MPGSRRTWFTVAAAGLVVLAVAFALFRPDKLFYDQVADEQLDDAVVAALADATTSTTMPPQDEAQTTTTAAAGPVVVATGSWVALDHPGSGAVAIIEDDVRTLVFDELATDNGPDLFVYLSPSPVEPGVDYLDGAVKIAPLKGNVGTQTYELPDDLDVSAFASVIIWCDRFASGFTAAPLTPV